METYLSIEVKLLVSRIQKRSAIDVALNKKLFEVRVNGFGA